VAIRRSEYSVLNFSISLFVKVSERIKFKLAVLSGNNQVSHTDETVLWSVFMVSLHNIQQITSVYTCAAIFVILVGDRAHSSAAPRFWNSQPTNSAPLLQSFCCHLKTDLNNISFPIN